MYENYFEILGLQENEIKILTYFEADLHSPVELSPRKLVLEFLKTEASYCISESCGQMSLKSPNLQK